MEKMRADYNKSIPQTPQAAPSVGTKNTEPENIRDFNATKFVSTNMKDYLDKDAHVYCVSCVDCIRAKRKVLQYKYNPAMRSNYAENFSSGDNLAR
jgi:hypothetical protein